MMPSHCWQSARLKFVAPLRNERTPAGADHAEYVGLENIESWTGRMIASEPKADKDSEAETGLANVFREGDVLFGKLRPYLAKACQAPRDGVCSTELLVMQPAEALNPRFLLYELLTPDFVGAVDASTFGARMPRASWDFIGSLEIRLPPLVRSGWARFRRTGRCSRSSTWRSWVTVRPLRSTTPTIGTTRATLG